MDKELDIHMVNCDLLKKCDINWDCCICLDYLFNPMKKCSECDIIYHKKCIEDCKNKNPNCPSCRSEFSIVDISRIEKSYINDIILKCINGCEVRLLECRNHLESNNCSK